jgi:two-component system response regulator AtoC
MVPLLQAKLLRFLEEKSFKRVGGSADIKVDVRVIAATNRSLQDEVKKGRFREDLFYRLNVMAVPLPPLRDRRDDVERLLHHYIDIFNIEFRKKIQGVSPGALKALQAYPWPGNVRELRNAVERAMLLTEGNELNEPHFPMLTTSEAELSSGMGLPASGINLEELERSLVVQALERSGWNQTKAATLLGLNRDQIRYRIEKFKLEKATPR